MFFVVVPISLLALLLARAALPESADPEGRAFDVPAQVLGALALGGLAFAAIEARDLPIWAVAALLAAAIAFVAFLRLEAGKGQAALVPLDIFGIGAFRGAIIGTIGMTFGMYGALFLVPLFWQQTGKLDPTAAGLGLMPMALVFLIVSLFSGSLGKRFGVRHITSGGVAVIGLGLLVIAFSADAPSIVVAEAGLVLTGVGLGLATGPLMGEAVGAVASARSGTASALINVARMTGATLGVAVLGAVYALAGGGGKGLWLALSLGGLVQIGCAIADFVQRRNGAPAQ
jgi:predicted MFS family arabinose efflux permease